ncbi:DUF2695 domain-containing protein [Georgenia sp. SYP-B2076]|uniref:DUF2695 domain-containing protein n=1 Tax=Georgenia sp. SYP-B2076 TaxID=2495881 RepID=UPI0035166DD3
MCFTSRMLAENECDWTLRWALRWQEARAPRATALRRRLADHGAYCDCEIFTNGWRMTLTPSVGTLASDTPLDGNECRGVRPGSTQPCARWEPRRRPAW